MTKPQNLPWLYSHPRKCPSGTKWKPVPERLTCDFAVLFCSLGWLFIACAGRRSMSSTRAVAQSGFSSCMCWCDAPGLNLLLWDPAGLFLDPPDPISPFQPFKAAEMAALRMRMASHYVSEAQVAQGGVMAACTRQLARHLNHCLEDNTGLHRQPGVLRNEQAESAQSWTGIITLYHATKIPQLGGSQTRQQLRDGWMHRCVAGPHVVCGGSDSAALRDCSFSAGLCKLGRLAGRDSFRRF